MYYKATGDVGAVLDASKAALMVADDPHLPEVVCHVTRLAKIEQGTDPGPPCPKIPTNQAPGRGVGLRYAVVPVRVLVNVREHPIMAIASTAGILLGLVAFGYALGRRRTA
jgi:hypothetical protein